MQQIVDFFVNGTPMTPAASWLLIGLLMVVALLATFAIRELDIFAQLAAYNVKEAGLKGIWYAAGGLEVHKIRKERVISVTRNRNSRISDIASEYGYRVHTSDGEYSDEYKIIVTDTDDSRDYEEAKTLAGSNKELFNAIKPNSRVRDYFSLRDKETGEEAHFFIMYLRYNNEKEVEDALNKFFEEEYYDNMRSARKTA